VDLSSLKIDKAQVLDDCSEFTGVKVEISGCLKQLSNVKKCLIFFLANKRTSGKKYQLK